MKKFAFFIALMVGLNAATVIRKQEEDENLAIVLKDEAHGKKRNHTKVIHNITSSLLICFYAITKEGRMEVISWKRISKLIKIKMINNQGITLQKNNNKLHNSNKINWVQLNYHYNGDCEVCEPKLLS